MTQPDQNCGWKLDADPWNGDSWDTQCGNKFEFTVDGPTDNGFKYCPYCGGKLSPTETETNTGDSNTNSGDLAE